MRTRCATGALRRIRTTCSSSGAHLNDAARGVGLAEIFLDSSLNAVPFYEAVGFEVIERRKYRLKSGREMDSIRMRKELG